MTTALIFDGGTVPTTTVLSPPSPTVSNEMARLALFGQWSLDLSNQRFSTNDVAAEFLQLSAQDEIGIDAFFTHVVPEDVPPLLRALNVAAHEKRIDCSFRVVTQPVGVRWYRMVSSSSDSAGRILAGALLDITDVKHGQLREQILFESTQYLIGFSSLEHAVKSVIKVVCESLGWQWGAYWAKNADAWSGDKLHCAYYWHADDWRLSAFTGDSLHLQMTPGQGLVGRTWSTGEASWVDDIADDATFLRRLSANQCGLHGGFAFPVTYVAENGERHSPGVLEFYSSVHGKRECQLPRLSAAIGAFIAQSAHRHFQSTRLQQISQIDDLSGAATRAHFLRLLDTACADAESKGEQLMLFCVRLHRTRQVSEGFGHDASRSMLREFGKRLHTVLPKECVVGRMLAGEFAVLAPPAVARSRTSAFLIDAIVHAASTPFHIGPSRLTTSASVGVAQFPYDSPDPKKLMQIASSQMHDGAAIPHFGLRMPLVKRLTMEAEIQAAIAGDEFYLEYQPIVDADMRMTAVEALVRWRRPNGDIVRPDDFIPVAEAAGLIGQVDRWVMARAVRDLARLHAAGFHTLQININIAADELVDPGLAGRLDALAELNEVEVRRICLELTERSVMKDPDVAIEAMGKLRARGFKISIDDFGTGYSSLARIMKLPATSIKMDRSFLQGLPDDSKNGPIVRTILDLGRHTKLPVIAEGVENERQLLYLRQFGCSHYQGYLFGRPLPVDALIQHYSTLPR